MDLVFFFVAVLSAAVAALGLIMYRLIKSLEIYLIPLYAEVIRKRERDYVLVEFLTSLLVSKGIISQAEAGALKSLSATGPLTAEDLDRVDEILDKDPKQLTYEEIVDLKRVAYKLLGRLDKKSVRLGLKLLRYAAGIEEALTAGVKALVGAQAEKVEMSYDHDTCSVYLTTYKRDGTVERSQGPDVECVTETVAVLKALARRDPTVGGELAEKALARYRKCRGSDSAGCRALLNALTNLEKKSLDLLLEDRR
ncbi:hypothetical protein [Pyrobaculum neutrophilum]|uniref:Uncharacterized protein n=1 Tax=Pyrobaculum neutrophilum (strain DSM 2338 / JCM 9278 / NBRC 100436 / V24Sta) TaxID=444157 RepID=B1YB03_PYRNV|nr:hypothetical protein [Pyrobaculum neutrophilum]ACB40703.1 conserved hypothetical protein [Pyrobaculum neutrophilum V24Sta]